MIANIASSNTLDLNDSFGTVKVVNFHNTDVNTVSLNTQVGVHALDFTKLLVDKTSASGSTASEVTVDITLNTNAQLTGSAASTKNAVTNSVNMLNYNETLGNSISFADVTMAQVVTALNGDAAAGVVTGGLVNATLTATGTNIVGTTQNHIIMLENNENPGEYKIFHVTSTVNDAGVIQNGGDFTGVTSLGTIDFGASINFSLVGNSAYDTFIAAYNEFVDNGTTGQTFNEYLASTAYKGTAVDAEYTGKLGDVVANTETVSTPTTTISANSTVTGYVAATGKYTVKNDATAITSTFDAGETISVASGVTLSGTAELLKGTATDGTTFVGAGSLKLTDTAGAAAANISAVDAKSSIVVDASSVTTGMTGTSAELAALYAAASNGTISGLGNETLTVSPTKNAAGTDITAAADLIAINNATTGLVSGVGAALNTITGSAADMKTLADMPAATEIKLDNAAILNVTGNISLGDLIALKTAAELDAGSLAAAITELNVNVTAAEIAGKTFNLTTTGDNVANITVTDIPAALSDLDIRGASAKKITLAITQNTVVTDLAAHITGATATTITVAEGVTLSGAGTALDNLTVTGKGNVAVTDYLSAQIITGIDNIEGTLSVTAAAAGAVGTIDVSGTTASSVTVDASASANLTVIKGSDVVDTITTGKFGDTVTAGKGNDIITLNATSFKDTVVFDATAANNGVDTITGFESGVSLDVLNFDAFLGTTDVTTGGADGIAIDATAGTAITTVTKGAAAGGTDLADQVFVWGGTKDALATAIEGASAANKLFLADGAKAVALVGTMADGAMSYDVYYITGTHSTLSNSETIELVGTVSVTDGNAFDHSNFA